MYKLFLALRYLRERAIAFVAIGAVTLCVAMVLVVSSVMGGWLDKIMENARGLLGDIIFDNASASGFPLYAEFIAEVSAWPEIELATPVIYTVGLAAFEDTTKQATVNIVGLRLDEARHVSAFGDGLFYDRFYPGTTTLGEQRQPVMGIDLDLPALECDGDLLMPPGLPEPYASARVAARAAGAPPVDDTSVPQRDGGLNNYYYHRCGLPPFPGQWYDVLMRDLDEAEAAARRDEPPATRPNWLDDNAPGYRGDPWPGIIFGRDIVAYRESDGRYDRQFHKGHVVFLSLWATSLRGSVDPIPRKQAFRYADDSRSGIYDIDSRSVYIDFDLAQSLVEWDQAERADDSGILHARCSQIQVKVAGELEYPALRALAARLEATYHEIADRTDLTPDERSAARRVDALTWQQSQQHVIGPVQKEKMLVTILFGIISLVAVALVLCILYMIVLQKTRDIGIIKSVGGSSTGVALIFVTYGAVVGLIGAALGVALGTVFVTNINSIQDYLIDLNPAWRVWDLKVYAFDTIPNSVNPLDALQVVVIAILASTIGSVAAAWRAGIMHPVEALRYE